MQLAQACSGRSQPFGVDSSSASQVNVAFDAQRVETVAAEFGRAVLWRPILLGVIFKITGQSPLVSQTLRGPYSARDMARSARKLGVKFALPDGFPFSSVYPCRIFYWLDSRSPEDAKAYARAIYHAAFADGKPPAEPEKN